MSRSDPDLDGHAVSCPVPMRIGQRFLEDAVHRTRDLRRYRVRIPEYSQVHLLPRRTAPSRDQVVESVECGGFRSALRFGASENIDDPAHLGQRGRCRRVDVVECGVDTDR